jgi:hypothetical protein
VFADLCVVLLMSFCPFPHQKRAQMFRVLLARTVGVVSADGAAGVELKPGDVLTQSA